MKRIIVALLVLVSGACSLSAQTKGESSLYAKTLKKPSVKAYEKFLTKYPESVYAGEMLYLRDSTLFAAVDQSDALSVEAFASAHPDSPLKEMMAELVKGFNTSNLSSEEACAVVRSLAPRSLSGAGYRKSGTDHVLGLGADDASNPVLYDCVLDSDSWKLVSETFLERYSNDPSLKSIRFDNLPEIVEIGAKKYLSFSYLNYNADSRNQEYVEAVYDIEGKELSSAMFYGRDMLSKASGNEILIEGQCPELLNGGAVLPEMVFLLNRIGADGRLVPISRANALTDDAIEWWLSRNPAAETKATKLTFGSLDEESSLVSGFKTVKSKDKDSSANFTAALFDIRGYTVIVAYSKSSKNYKLVWCEPVCKDKNRDKLLNTIYFEDANTLDLFYYKGKTTFKIRVNVATMAVRR